MSSTITRRGLETLKGVVAGAVFVPADDGYDAARRARSLFLDHRHAVVVVADVVRAEVCSPPGDAGRAAGHGSRGAAAQVAEGRDAAQGLADAALGHLRGVSHGARRRATSGRR
jgi:hypothetical protein